MAYFSNSTDGSYLDEQCMRCIHGNFDDEQDGCPVYLLQSLWNYDAAGKDADQTKKFALDVLIPDEDKDGNSIPADCRMFVADPNFVDPRQMRWEL